MDTDEWPRRLIEGFGRGTEWVYLNSARIVAEGFGIDTEVTGAQGATGNSIDRL